MTLFAYAATLRRLVLQKVAKNNRGIHLRPKYFCGYL